jgi:hypothetical protein
MRIPPHPLSVDLSAPVSGAFFVVEIEHEHGTVLLSDRAGLLGGRSLLPAVLAWGSIEAADADLTCAASALPDWLEWWAGRPARVWEVPPGATGLTDATVVCEGEVGGQPEVQGTEARLRVVPRRLRLAQVPDAQPIDAVSWPDAGETALGRYPAEVYGTVDDCPLLPVALPRHSALSASVELNATALPVDDATVFPATAGTVVVDGVSYTYTSRDDATLMGVQVVRPHRAGTAVSQPGAAVFLAAGHAVEAIGPRRSEGRVVAGGAVDLSAATVTYPALPTVEDLGDLHTYTAEFDAVATGSTATDGANAIRAATGQVTQSGSTGTISSDGQFLFVPFPRPSAIGGTDTIILGGYTVAFSVIYAGTNRLSITIGGAVVYVEDGGTVVYNASPASFFYHDNTDQLPIQFGGLGEGETASITITSASRTVTLGNDDTAAYATLDRTHNVLAVRQTTDMPDRGRVERARLAVEFWLSDALQAGESVGVSWRGNSLGTLRQTTDGRTTEDATVSFDLSQIGSAQLQSNNIAVSASGGTTRLNNVPTVVQATATFSYDELTPGIWRGKAILVPPPNVKGKLHYATVVAQSGSGSATFGVHDSVTSSIFSQSSSRSDSVSSGGTETTGFFVSSGQAVPCGISHTTLSQGATRLESVTVNWEVDPLSNTDTPASASRSYPNPSVPLSGSYSGGSTITIPAPARTVVNYFDLPERAWSDFTDQTASLTLTTSRSDLAVYVARVVLLLEYRPVAHLPVIDLTATVTGRSGNPADVLDDLARRLGTRLEPLSGRRLRRWADAVGWAFARRIDAPTDATQLLNDAVAQVLAVPVETADGLRVVRRLDGARAVTEIDESDLLLPVVETWTSVEDVTTRVDVRTGAERLVSRGGRTGNRWALLAGRQVRREASAEVSADWLRSDAVAAAYADDWLRLNGPLRRVVRLDLPYTYAALEVGDLIALRGQTYEVAEVVRDGAGYLTLSATQIPTEI